MTMLFIGCLPPTWLDNQKEIAIHFFFLIITHRRQRAPPLLTRSTGVWQVLSVCCAMNLSWVIKCVCVCVCVCVCACVCTNSFQAGFPNRSLCVFCTFLRYFRRVPTHMQLILHHTHFSVHWSKGFRQTMFSSKSTLTQFDQWLWMLFNHFSFD